MLRGLDRYWARVDENKKREQKLESRYCVSPKPQPHRLTRSCNYFSSDLIKEWQIV